VPGIFECFSKTLKLLSHFQKTTYTLPQPQNLHKLVKSAWHGSLINEGRTSAFTRPQIALDIFEFCDYSTFIM